MKILILTILLFPIAVFAECNMEDDGDCCNKPSDCTVVVHPALCAVIPINKAAAAKLQEEAPKPLDFCKPETLDRLKRDAAGKKPFCLRNACEYSGDNG